MPIEIREIVIKTEIRTSQSKERHERPFETKERIRKLIIEECKRILFQHKKRSIHRR